MSHDSRVHTYSLISFSDNGLENAITISAVFEVLYEFWTGFWSIYFSFSWVWSHFRKSKNILAQKIFQKAQNMSTNRNTNLLVINVNS